MNDELNIIENVDNFINFFVVMYSQEYTIPKDLKYRIQVVDDLAESVRNFMKRINREYTSDGIDYNGTTCVPNNINKETEIFISRQLVENYKTNNWQFMCTVFHELTHAIDFYNYCKKYYEGNYDSMTFSSNSCGFKMWTEFNAKKISYLMYSRFLRKVMQDSNIQPANPVDGEVDFQNNIITESLRRDKLDTAIYDIVLYLGRYYCWEIDYPDKFTNGSLFPDVFKQNLEPEISNLYDLLKQDNNSVDYYIKVDKQIRFLKGKLITIEHEGGVL